MFDQLKRLLKHFKNHENDIKINVNILQHDTGGIKVVIGLYKNISEIQTSLRKFVSIPEEMDDVSPFIKKNSEAVFISLKVETHFAIHIQNNQVVIIESTEILEEFVDFRRIFREVNPRVQYEAATQEHIEAAAFFRLLEVNLQCYLVLRKEVQALSEQFTRFFFLNSRVKSKRQYHNRYIDNIDFLLKHIRSQKYKIDLQAVEDNYTNTKKNILRLFNGLEKDLRDRWSCVAFSGSIGVMLAIALKDAKIWVILGSIGGLLLVSALGLYLEILK